MVGFPSDVQECYFGPNGLLENAKPGTLLIDLTTSKPSLAQEIEALASAKEMLCLDAPVSGGDVGARNATLVIMCGGKPEGVLFNKGLLCVLLHRLSYDSVIFLIFHFSTFECASTLF
jgi:3-hydroxyisobutyrate dehydrogenase